MRKQGFDLSYFNTIIYIVLVIVLQTKYIINTLVNVG